MTAWLNALAPAWASIMGRALLQGLLAAALIWALCALLHLGRNKTRWGGTLAGVHCWLWRGVYLKVMLCLIPLAAIPLPFLPASTLAPASSRTPPSAQSFSPESSSAQTKLPELPPAAEFAAPPAPLHPAAPPAPRLTLAAWAMLAWFLGVTLCLLRLARSFRAARTLRQAAHPIHSPPFQDAARRLADALDIRTLPALLSSGNISSPLLLGILHPAILLPDHLLSDASPHNRDLALAHELAHLRRRDLPWQLFQSLVESLFFFHPALWLARPRLHLAREIACDDLTLAATGQSRSTYGQLLVDLIAAAPAGRRLSRTPAALGVAGSASTLHRRLIAMKSLAPITRRRLILTSTLAATALLATLLPWQVVAQTSPPTAARGNSAAPSTAPTASPNPAAPAAKAPTPPEPGLFGAQEEPPTQFLQQTSYASRVSAPVVDIVPAMDGTLQEIAVKEGDHVKKGQLLFRFDAHDAEIALRLQQLAVDRAKMQVAVPEGVASKSEIDQAKSRLQTEQIILEARAHEVAMASVLAPIDGVVSSINLTPGQFIPKGQHLTRVVDLSSMSLFTSIPSEALAKVKVGQKISFHLMNSDHVYPAQITYIAPMLDDNFAVEAKAAFTVPADDLRPGMIGSASIDSK